MINFNYLVVQFLYQIFKIYFEHIIKKHEPVTDNSPIRLYINKIENKIIFKIETGYSWNF